MEKRVYLKDIKDNEELLKEIFNSNEELKTECYKDTYETNMEQQLEFGQLCLGDNYNDYISIMDNYSSFYLVLKDSVRFIENIDKDYLTPVEEKIYNKAVKTLEKRNNVDMYNDRYDRFKKYDTELNKLAEELLDLIEEDLHAYEDIDEETAVENFIFNLQYNYMYEDLYYYEDDKNYNLYEDISYTKNWN